MQKIWCFIVIVFFGLLLTACESADKADREKETKVDVAGYYEGAIEIPNQPLGIEVTLQKQDSELSGMMSIPVQGLLDYPLTTVKQHGEKAITFITKVQNHFISFEGEIEAEQITGTFKQNGQSFPFQLAKAKQTAEKDEEFLQVETAAGTLSAELLKPNGKEPYPVMLIIPGSGQTDRDGNTVGIAGKNNSLKLLAEGLADQGIATIRYDKRGVGKNSQAIIDERDIQFDQFVDDAAAFIDKLEADNRFTKIGVIGHSQGSLVGMLASLEKDMDVFISLAGFGSPSDEGIYNQLQAQPKLPKELLRESKGILQSLKEGKTVNEVGPELQPLLRPSVQPFLISWMKHDPQAVIAELQIPTFIVQGERDIQVPANEATILHEAAPNSELLLLEKMNHILKDAPKDREENMGTYTNSKLPLAEGLIEEIVDFLMKNGFLS
ncbi:S9 family peptidase [Virgibacillus sp. Bac330]|uniref:alpha/beta hydrolase family protein n=1 Tax=Virgibacillus sp. Bac330 TaxID=2419841 RepID=UPI0013CEF32A|nr:alpha/beta fold hydrolase [Virgibacillus sp. Bac330]